MENPGLKRHISDKPFLKVAIRRTALATPHTDTTESSRAGQPLSDYSDDISRDGEGYLRRDNIETPPPLMGGGSTPGPSADNGAYGADPWIEDHNPSTSSSLRTAAPRTAGEPTTQIPGEVRTNSIPAPTPASMQAQQTKAEEQRRIETQQQVGGGTKENPAYEQAQENIDQHMMQRQLRAGSTHPLYQDKTSALVERPRKPWEDDSLRYWRDTDFTPVPTGYTNHTRQPMFQIKDDLRGVDEGSSAHEMLPDEPCETCWLERGDPVSGPQVHTHWDLGHEFKPFATQPGQRFSHHNPTQDMHDLLDVQGTYGNWDYDPYMHGLYNGMELGSATHEGRDPEFRDAPDHWLAKDAGAHSLPDPEDDDPYGEISSLINNVPLAKNPDERPPTYPTRQQARDLAGLGYQRFGDDFGGDMRGSYWVKPVGNKDHYISPSREEPRGGYWETRIGPRGHWDENQNQQPAELDKDGYPVEPEDHDPVVPVMHKDFRNAVQRVTDPYGWYQEHQHPDPEMWNQDKAVPGETREFDPHLRDYVIQSPNLSAPGFDLRDHDEFKPKNPGLTRLNAFDPERGEFVYDIDAPGYPDRLYKVDDEGYPYKDVPPSRNSASNQPMFKLKDSEAEYGLDGAHNHPDYPACSRCDDLDFGVTGPDDSIHDLERSTSGHAHPYQPMKELSPGVRLASVKTVAADPHDPVFPYNPRPNPEHDTVDLDNLQDEDDTYRPHHPLVDRAINHLQGLPDVSRGHPLMEQVNNVLDQAPDDEESTRGADALAMGLNTIFDSTRENSDLSREEQLQRAKDAIDAHVETGKLSYNDHVKRLHDDWLARGGHATGEPRPVGRFSAKYSKPQQIVPDPNQIYPELTTPILYAGKCEGCGTKLYDSADSDGDPRGPLGDHTVGTIDAAEYSPRDDPSGEQRMHGPSALICPNCNDDQDRHDRILDKYMGHKAGEPSGGFHWQWQWQPDGSQKNVRVDYTHYKDRKGKWHNPGEKVGSCPECDQGITGFHRRQSSYIPSTMGRFSDQHSNILQASGRFSDLGIHKSRIAPSRLSSLYKQGETDEEFWERMNLEHPGEQHAESQIHSPDAVSQSFVDPDYEPDEQDAADLDDPPTNTSLAEHTHLVNNGFDWNGREEYPKYTKENWRNIIDSDGRPSHDQEGQVIERNTHIMEPQHDDAADALEYPWTHTYYPAGMRDDEGLTAGYNTAHQAARAAIQLGLWGARHPESQDLLSRYRYLGRGQGPYDPRVEFPAETAMR